MNMRLRQTIFDIKSFFAIQWLINRRIFIWIGLCMLAGVAIGLITLFSPNVTAARIGKNFIDSNVLNAISPRANIGSFIIARLLEFVFCATFIFILCQTKITSYLTFGFIAFRTCTVTINLYWIIARLGMTGGILFIFYLIFFLVLLCLLAATAVFIMKECANLRSYGYRRGIEWKGFFKVMLVFACFATAVALLEWLCFWLIFSKILWPAVFEPILKLLQNCM